MLSFKNFTAHPLTTLAGALLGVLQAAAVAAAAVFSSSGNITDPKPYIAAASVGAASFVLGGLLSSGSPAPASSAPMEEPKPLGNAGDLAAPELPKLNALPLAPPEIPAAPIVPPDVVQAAGQLAVQLLMSKLAPEASAPPEPVKVWNNQAVTEEQAV
jgi:hypothetical protein